MQSLRKFLVFGCCFGVLGCSASDTASPGGRRSPTASVGGSPSMAAGAGATGDLGNGTGKAPVLGDKPTTQPGQTQPIGGARLPMSVDECGAGNPAGLSDADAQKLMAGSGGPGSLRLLNPYDGTVFPRGILPPTLMWDGDNGTQFVYLHISSRLLEYKGCLKPTAAGQLLLPQAVWDVIGVQTEGAVDPYLVELSVMGGGNVVGPAPQHWTVAQATLKGSIYYNSYASKLGGGAGGLGGGNGMVLRIPRGKPAEPFLGMTACTACHSVSANGSRMVAMPIGGLALGGNSASYPLTADGAANPAPLSGALANGAFAGVSPDGTLFVTSAHMLANLFAIIGPRAGGPGAIGGATAGLFETATGAAVAGSGIVEGAMMAMFSPDGAHLAFTDLAIDTGRGIAVMDFDMAQRKASAYRQIYATGDATKYPGWPFYLPDNKALVFAIGAAPDFSGLGVGVIAGAPVVGAPVTDLFFVDLVGGQPKILAKAMGFASEQDAQSGTTYLPFGAEDLHHHYYPTVAPVAAGGYFWIFFDAIRHYGNEGVQRQIWGAAIDVSADGTYTTDASHPAFYLTGQEAGSGNHRAFAALDPCEMDGETCTSGTDCCGGFCFVKESDSEFATEPIGTCTADVPECAKINDRCTSTADCCPPDPGAPKITCIAGFCAVLQVVE